MRTELRGKARSTTTISLQNSTILTAFHSHNRHNIHNGHNIHNIHNGHNSHSSLSVSGALKVKGCLGSLDGACIEKLLLHCASALESNDITLAQQVMWVLNNVASQLGDPNQRLTSWFLRALISRASKVFVSPPQTTPTLMMNFNGSFRSAIHRRRKFMSVTELARYVDLIPWHRFGFSAANTAIYKAIQMYPKVHILDFSITHCMQWPTFIDVLSKRLPQGPPSLRITVVPSFMPSLPAPLLDLPTEEIGIRLAKFANSKNIPFEFNVIEIEIPSISNELNCIEPSSLQFGNMVIDKLNPTDLNLREDEALVINCQHWLRYLSDEKEKVVPRRHENDSSSQRDNFLNIIKWLNPRIMIVVEEDSDLSSSSDLTSRISSCFNYLWIPFDAFETFLPKDSEQRLEYEADIGDRIENMISFEGKERVERSESIEKLSLRMRNAGYLVKPFCEETTEEVKGMLAEQSSGWGMKKEDDTLVLTWKGHNSVFVTAWVPSPSPTLPNGF